MFAIKPPNADALRLDVSQPVALARISSAFAPLACLRICHGATHLQLQILSIRSFHQGNMAGRLLLNRPRCSLDVRSGGTGQPAARRFSVDIPAVNSYAAPASAGLHLGSRTASGRLAAWPVQAVAETQQQNGQQGFAEQPDMSLEDIPVCRLPRVLIAGAGIGGLVLAVALLKRGFRVQIFERDLTAIRGEGKYRGPIQVCSARSQ